MLVCQQKKTILFIFAEDTSKYGINAYKYMVSSSLYNRSGDGDCHASYPTLPNGISDASKCYFGK